MIMNTRNHMYLASRVKVANHAWSRIKGLIGKKKLAMHTALLIYPCRQIHTYFMTFPIDCLFITKEYRIVQCIHALQPWRMTKKIPEAWGVIELPAGVIAQTYSQVHDVLHITSE